MECGNTLHHLWRWMFCDVTLLSAYIDNTNTQDSVYASVIVHLIQVVKLLSGVCYLA